MLSLFVWGFFFFIHVVVRPLPLQYLLISFNHAFAVMPFYILSTQLECISSSLFLKQPEQTLAVTGSNEDRLEQRVQKIEDKLYSKEPYLAQLLKLDSIGADVLSQEKEKQIR